MFSEKEKLQIINDKEKLFEIKKFYSIPLIESCIDFINEWVFIYDPWNENDKVLPFHLFNKQEEFLCWLWDRYKKREDGAVDKCRDVGATWTFVAFSIWILLFQKNISIAFFTFKALECHRIGDISTLFGKANFILDRLPKEFKEDVESKLMYLRNKETNSDIVGAAGDNPLRSNRRSIIFKDESAFYEQAEMIDAAMSESSNCKIDISTHAGTNTVFYNKVTSGALPVFIFDWYDNPIHTQEWFDKRKKKALLEGTYHIFQREILRNAQASIASVLIPSEWVNSSKQCEIRLTGKKIVSLDVADEGTDTNALCSIDGNVLMDLDEWQTPDPNVSARKTFFKAVEVGADEIRFDCIGVGAGVKAGFNSIIEELQKDPDKNQKALNIRIIGWSAAGKVIRPKDNDYGDRGEGEKTNEELFENAKAQAYFKIQNEFLHTFHYINNEKYDETKLICFKDVMSHRLFNKFVNELSQPIQKLSARGKTLIDKKGKGKSPNLADCYMIARAELEPELASSWDRF